MGTSPRPAASGARPLVLYVEDDENNVEVARLRLEPKFELLSAATDREACVLLRAHGPRLLAVLMDVELRGSTLDGLRLTRVIRGLLRPELVPEFARGLPEVHAPIFIVTAYGEQYPTPMVLEAGAEGAFYKPVDFVKVAEAMAAASARAVFRHLTGDDAPPKF